MGFDQLLIVKARRVFNFQMEPQPIDEILDANIIARQTMDMQVTKISEILEKSNNILLHIESKAALKAPAQPLPGQIACEYGSESENALVKIVDNFVQLVQQSDAQNMNETSKYSSLDGCMAYRQRVDYLGSSVRKFMALYDAVTQMKQNLAQTDAKHEDSSEEDEVDN